MRVQVCNSSGLAVQALKAFQCLGLAEVSCLWVCRKLRAEDPSFAKIDALLLRTDSKGSFQGSMRI